VGGGYLAFRAIKRLIPMEARRSTVFAAAFAGWFGTVLASLSCAGQLALSGTVPWGLAFPAMTNVHMLIGVGEGLATGLIALAVARARPELVAGTQPAARASGATLLAFGLLVCAGLALFVAPFACPWPDGLEAVAKTLGFAGKSVPSPVPAALADYRLPFIGSATVATAVAGLIGTILAFVAAFLLARFVVPGLSASSKDASSGS
jgi:cobalt/nickel transport system permease protein